jgi:hypothetical protein
MKTSENIITYLCPHNKKKAEEKEKRDAIIRLMRENKIQEAISFLQKG